MISGFVLPDFGAVTETLRKTIHKKKGGGGGGAVAVYHRGELVADAWAGARDSAGAPWDRDTVAMSFSTTKGVVATTVHRLRDQGLVDYDEPVATYWPEFKANGKERITVRHLLSHSAGLHHLRGVIDNAHEMLDWEHITARLAAAEPRWEPGVHHGYHGITYGFLVGEVIRRVTGLSVHDAVQREIVEPLGLDGMFIGTPPDHRHRVADLIMGFGGGPARIEGLMARAERIEKLRPTIEAFMVEEFDRLLLSDAVHDAELPALNGCFTARSLARMYAALANGGVLDGKRFLSEETLREATTVQTRSRDVVVGVRMQWRLGYHMAGTTRGFLPHGFGHFGYGGSGAWADPDTDLAVAMVCNRVAGTPFADARFMRVGGAALRCAKTR
ncbi:MAG: serine hydrolase domain-containing protein [Acidimicrobiia bacterium]